MDNVEASKVTLVLPCQEKVRCRLGEVMYANASRGTLTKMETKYDLDGGGELGNEESCDKEE